MNMEIYPLSSQDSTVLLILVILVGAILAVMLAVIAFKVIQKLPKKAKDELKQDIMKQLAEYKNLLPKLQEQLQAADIDQRDTIQARIDNVNKKIKALEKKAKLPKTSA